MKKPTFYMLQLVFLAAAFLAGSWYHQRTVTRNTAAGVRKILYYVDPMHPAYKSDKPGIAPDCGMELVPVYEDGSQGQATEPGASRSAPAGAVTISPTKQQLMGVQVSRVEKTSGTRTLRLFGRIAPDEALVYKLNAGTEGYIQEVSPVTTGSQVQKDQLLATFSAPNATGTIQTYILNVGAEDRFTKAPGGSPEAQSFASANSNILQRTQQLQNLGMSPVQIEEIKRTRVIPGAIKIVAPADGFVLARNVSPGLKFERGAEFYRIADLRRVWILADVSETDAQYIRPGIRAQVSLRNQGKVVPARISSVLPQFDSATGRLRVRLEAENPGFVLRPDMLVDVEFPVRLPSAITAPVDAVIDSGLTKTVFVDRGNGYFEPRMVETGWRFGDQVEVVKGLQPGERIVVSGTFLVDSESRLKMAAAGVYSAPTKDPVCGMDVDEAKAKAAGRHIDYGGKAHYFCSDQCQQKFVKEPERYLSDPAEESGHGPSVQKAKATSRSSDLAF